MCSSPILDFKELAANQADADELLDAIIGSVRVTPTIVSSKGYKISSEPKPTQICIEDLDTNLCAPAKSNGSSFCDPAFASNKSRPIHRWTPWIAGFSEEFVSDALKNYLSSKGVVMDPFAGVGTTLVAALTRGHDTLGFEINPYAALACQVKLQLGELDASKMTSELKRYSAFYGERVSSNYQPITSAPKGFRSQAPFYSEKVLRKVLLTLDYISSIDNPQVRDVFRLALGSIMVSFSNYSYEPSLGRRKSVGKADIEDYDVGASLNAKVSEMCADVKWYQARAKGYSSRSEFHKGSFFEEYVFVKPESVDLCITSPPYLNNYHYIRNTRPQMFWLDLVQESSELKELENLNFGKYWQTVRESEPIGLDASTRSDEAKRIINELRLVTPEKGIYGGKGWANYAASYFNDCARFAKASHHVMKPGATALVVLGNSILQGIQVHTDRIFAEIAEPFGFEVVDIHIPRATRVGNSIIQSDVRVKKATKAQSLYEAVVELKRL